MGLPYAIDAGVAAGDGVRVGVVGRVCGLLLLLLRVSKRPVHLLNRHLFLEKSLRGGGQKKIFNIG